MKNPVYYAGYGFGYVTQIVKRWRTASPAERERLLVDGVFWPTVTTIVWSVGIALGVVLIFALAGFVSAALDYHQRYVAERAELERQLHHEAVQCEQRGGVMVKSDITGNHYCAKGVL